MALGSEPRPRCADRTDPIAPAPQARRLRGRRLLPAQGTHGACAQAERTRRLARLRSLGRRPAARRGDASPHSRRQAPLRDRLPRPPLRPGAPVRRHARALQARHLDARSAGHLRSAHARVHGRGLRVRPADRGTARQEADPDRPQAGTRFRRRDGARDPESRRPRLQGDVERRHLARRSPPDRARQGTGPRGPSLRCGRHRRPGARHRDRWPRQATVPARQRQGLARPLRVALGAVVPPRPADEGPDRDADA